MQSVEALIRTTMEQLKAIVDVNTIVGQPIYADSSTLVVPVSKIAFGFLTGGSDLPVNCTIQKCGAEVEQKGDGASFAGAAVAGVTVTPKAFLCVREGQASVLHAEYSCTLDKLVEIVPQILSEVSRGMRAMREQQAEQKRAEQKKQQRDSEA